ncbi:MAG: TldD/PmbA family protein [Candidatus Aminicenantes bacterium]|nr:TldD/PmbA family protein [Candidatus Aminicenantes bacterium]
MKAAKDQMDENLFGLKKSDLEQALNLGLSKGGEFSELFVERRAHTSLLMEDDIIKDTAENVVLGLGVRVIRDGQTGYAYTSDLSEEAVHAAASTAASVAAGGAPRKPFPLKETIPVREPDPLRIPSHAAPLEVKIRLVRETYDAARHFDPAVNKVKVSLSDCLQNVLIANSEGLLVEDRRPMLRLGCLVLAEKGGRRESGFSGGGGRVGLEALSEAMSPAAIAADAAREAADLLEARDAPAGEMPVVLAAGHSGVFIHEAVGHLLEADFVRKKTSVFWDKLGRRVGSGEVTIFDDPTLPSFRGSYRVDDEGTVPSKTPLVEKGVLTGLLQDRISARILRRPLTGHGRRQDFTCPPLPRMSNIFVDRGEFDPEDIIRSVKKGLYAERFLGGQVEDSGKFTFTVSSGRLIENGRLTRRVKHVTLIGSNLDILRKMTMVGSDLAFGLPTGTCSKDGQDVPVTDGCPTLKVSSMTVGGSLED